MSEKLGGVTIDTPKNGNRIKKSGSPTRSGQLQDAASVPIDSILDNDLGSVLLPQDEKMLFGKQSSYYVEENEKVLHILVNNCQPILQEIVAKFDSFNRFNNI